MSEQSTAYVCLAWMCAGWPLLWAAAAYHVGRYGLRGSFALWLTRLRNITGAQRH